MGTTSIRLPLTAITTIVTAPTIPRQTPIACTTPSAMISAVVMPGDFPPGHLLSALGSIFAFRRSKNSPRFLLLRLQLFNECSEVRRHRCREGIVLVPQSFFGRTARTEISDCQRMMSF
jgi:hypothetical protein